MERRDSNKLYRARSPDKWYLVCQRRKQWNSWKLRSSPGETTHQGNRDKSPHIPRPDMSLGKHVKQNHDRRGNRVPRPESLLPRIQRSVASRPFRSDRRAQKLEWRIQEVDGREVFGAKTFLHELVGGGLECLKAEFSDQVDGQEGLDVLSEREECRSARCRWIFSAQTHSSV